MKPCMQEYERWLSLDGDTRRELEALGDEAQIEDRFYCDISFGTGGIRGLMGAGTNRINAYTVGRATAGVAGYMREAFPGGGLSAVIAYDTRRNSRELARRAAEILTARGIRTYLFRRPTPTPVLSFAVRYLQCQAGIVITASHNPKEYNGYKVYDETGCQLVPEKADAVARHIKAAPGYDSLPREGCTSLLTELDDGVTDAFVDAVLAQSRYDDPAAKAALKIVYTPLHGTGLLPVTRALLRSGFENLLVVPEQAEPDGDFPTVESPNPENRGALERGILLAQKTGADIVLGTDPDADRIGVAVRTDGGYRLLSGNEVGALLVDFLLAEGSALENPAIVKTVVTGDLGARIAREKGVAVLETLTGFKYIGSKITDFERNRDHTFLFGYEESYGYLAGTHARDKDAVSAALLICQMAARHLYGSSGNRTLADVLERLYGRYGFYLDALDTFTCAGKAGAERIARFMESLRGGRPPMEEAVEMTDYRLGAGGLPRTDMLKYVLNDGSWMAVRPSGTEPKIKFYYSLRRPEDAARATLSAWRKGIRNRLDAL